MNVERTFLNGTPTVGFGGETLGFGEAEVIMPATTEPSPWVIALATSAAATATGWALEEIRNKIRGKKHQR